MPFYFGMTSPSHFLREKQAVYCIYSDIPIIENNLLNTHFGVSTATFCVQTDTASAIRKQVEFSTIRRA